MKRHLHYIFSSFALLLLTLSLQAQQAKTDNNPTYDQFNDRCILDKVEYTEDRTIFHFRYKASQYTSVWLYAPDGAHPWFLKDEQNGEEYNLLGVYNVRRNNRMVHKSVPHNQIYMSADSKKEKTYFECEVHFERLPKHVKEVDLIEGRGMESAWNHFHCLNIQVSPLKEAVKYPITPIQTEDLALAPTVNLLEDAVQPIALKTPKATENNNTIDATQNFGSDLIFDVVTVGANWSVFPTPAINTLNVKQSTTDRAQLELITVSGQTVWTGTTNGTITKIDISNFPAGAYFLKHTSHDVTTAQKVLIK